MMKRFITIVTAVCGKFFAGFVQQRLLAEFPHADELIQFRGMDYRNDDAQAGCGPPMIGVL